jgi:lipoyl(octanoyl) transferase
MDLSPFSRINPCGFADLEVTQLSELCEVDDLKRFRDDLTPTLLTRLNPLGGAA